MENYFELYGMPVQFGYDAAAVRKKYLELSRQFHPDRFATAGEEARNAALRDSANVNEAYQTLNNDDLRMAYILKLEGVLEEEEKYSLPPSFLMDMMDLNESLDGGNEQVARQAWEAAMADWSAATAPLLQQFDQGTKDASLLSKIKDFYFQRKYLLRIKDRLDTFATS